MITPESCAQGRQIRSVIAEAGAEVLYYEGGHAALRMINERGPFEILATADRSSDFLHAVAAETPMELTGYWRPRNGFRANGDRYLIWCLVLLSWSEAQALAA